MENFFFFYHYDLSQFKYYFPHFAIFKNSEQVASFYKNKSAYGSTHAKDRLIHSNNAPFIRNVYFSKFHKILTSCSAFSFCV